MTKHVSIKFDVDIKNEDGDAVITKTRYYDRDEVTQYLKLKKETYFKIENRLGPYAQTSLIPPFEPGIIIERIDGQDQMVDIYIEDPTEYSQQVISYEHLKAFPSCHEDIEFTNKKDELYSKIEFILKTPSHMPIFSVALFIDTRPINLELDEDLVMGKNHLWVNTEVLYEKPFKHAHLMWQW